MKNMIIRNTLAKTAASFVGACIGNAIIKNTNHYKPKGDKYIINDYILEIHDVTARIAGTICPVLLSALFGKSMVNMRHLGGLACAGMMISAVTTNHYYQHEQIKVREEEHDKAQTTLTRTQEELTETEEERNRFVQRFLENQANLEQYQRERIDSEQRQWETQFELNQAQRERTEAQQQVRQLVTRITALRQQNNPEAQIRLRLGAVYSESDRFTVDDNNRITTAPYYEDLSELRPNNQGQYDFANNECMITRKPVNEMYQPVALKTGNIYNVAEYVDLKLWFRTNLSNPSNRQELTAEMLNTTDDNQRVLFRINRDINVS